MRTEFISIIKEIAEEHNKTVRTYAKDWIVEVQGIGKVVRIFGYLFPCNSGTAAEIAKEKPATSRVLENAGIPCIPHECFLNAAHPLAGPYVGSEGSLEDLFRFFKLQGSDLVLKPLKGTGGIDVFRCRSIKEIEVAAMNIFAKEYGLAACPFLSLGHEYRAIVLQDKVKLVYRKSRVAVVGDGKRRLEELVVEQCRAKHVSWKATAEALAGFNKVELNEIIPENKTIPIQWKHNLGLGLSEVELDIPDKLKAEIETLAINSALAIGLIFCSVDIAEHASQLIVVEVNCGVMMDVFARTHRAIAKQVYKEALQLCFRI